MKDTDFYTTIGVKLLSLLSIAVTPIDTTVLGLPHNVPLYVVEFTMEKTDISFSIGNVIVLRNPSKEDLIGKDILALSYEGEESNYDLELFRNIKCRILSRFKGSTIL
jgi:hypothetical protein